MHQLSRPDVAFIFARSLAVLFEITAAEATQLQLTTDSQPDRRQVELEEGNQALSGWDSAAQASSTASSLV